MGIAFDPTTASPEAALAEAERRKILRELGLPFSSPLTLAECRARQATATLDLLPLHATAPVGPRVGPGAGDRAGGCDAAAVSSVPRVPGLGPAIEIGSPPYLRRSGDVLELVLLVAPRTKKNSVEHVARQSLGYRRYRNVVAKTLLAHREALGLPLPEGTYNVEALFFTDNERADTQGLIQGLSDALENATVVTNDRQFRTWDGTDQFLDPLMPRVEVRITPRPVSPPRALGLYRSWRADVPPECRPKPRRRAPRVDRA